MILAIEIYRFSRVDSLWSTPYNETCPISPIERNTIMISILQEVLGQVQELLGTIVDAPFALSSTLLG